MLISVCSEQFWVLTISKMADVCFYFKLGVGKTIETKTRTGGTNLSMITKLLCSQTLIHLIVGNDAINNSL